MAACRAQDLRHQMRDGEFRASINSGQLIEGDKLPLPDTCDNVATIKIYLHDSGYAVNDEQASQVRSYLLAHGLKHVSDLGQ
jgi:hypothetical protein